MKIRTSIQSKISIQRVAGVSAALGILVFIGFYLFNQFGNIDDSYASSCTTINIDLNDDDDDAEEKSNGDMDLGSSDLDLGDKTVGLLYKNVNIPQGASISSAFVTFTAKKDNSDTFSVTIHGEKDPDADDFSSSDDDITDRTLTNASVTWSIGAWDKKDEYATADISTIIEEIVGQAGWSSGNSLVLIFGTASDDKPAYSRDGSSSRAPTLEICYGGGSGGNGQSTISGVVFRDFDSDGTYDSHEQPQAAVVLNLYNDANANGVIDGGESIEATTNTIADGTYSFSNIDSGNYLLYIPSQHLPPDKTYSTDSVLDFAFTNTAVNATNEDIGYVGGAVACIASADEGQERLAYVNRYSGFNYTIPGGLDDADDVMYHHSGSSILYPDDDEGDEKKLVYIDRLTGAMTPMSLEYGSSSNGPCGSITFGDEDIEAAGYDPTTTYLYLTDEGEGCNDGDIMFIVNDTTGEFRPGLFTNGYDYVELSGDEKNIEGLAVHPATGVMYGVDGDDLVTIDKMTGVTTDVGELDRSCRALTFASDGTMYGAKDKEFFSIDISTLTTTLIATLPDDDYEGCDCVSGTSVDPCDAFNVVLDETDETVSLDDGKINSNPNFGLAPHNFTWSNGLTSQNINSLHPGTYIVTVTDDRSCVEIDTGKVYPIGNYISGLMYQDVNTNGNYDKGQDNLLPNAAFKLYEDVDQNGLVNAPPDILKTSSTSDADGFYALRVAGLAPAESKQYIAFVEPSSLPAGAVLTTANKHIKNLTGTRNLEENNHFGYRISGLPVQLVSFTATQQDNGSVLLEWVTASEINSDYYTIERTTDGIDFDMLGEVDGAGNSTSHKYYAFVDDSPKPGINYYQLTQYDFDGQFERFPMESIHNKMTATSPISEVKVYPNPFSNQVTIEFDAEENGMGSVCIINAGGQVVSQESLMVYSGRNQSAPLYYDRLPDGIYFLFVECSGQRSEVVKLVKQTDRR